MNEHTTTISIAKVRIDEAGRLHVIPASNPSKMFRFIYRAAMEVDWDEEEQGFYTPVPRELSYADWYTKVLTAVQSEMGVLLQLGDVTIWENVPADVEGSIKERNQKNVADNANGNGYPEAAKGNKVSRGALQAIGGAVPFLGGLFAAIAGAWSENDQERVNQFFRHWVQMLRDELREKEQTIIEIMARLDVQDEAISKRIESQEYQSLLKKTFREWAGAESEKKREYIRNILANAAASQLSSDDVVRLFIDWIKEYSELHFQVIAAIYNANGISRGQIWRKIGKVPVREDSADADLYRLLFRDLSTGGIVRQHRETDYHGNFVQKAPKRRTKAAGQKSMKSAFDDEELYELTELGKQFIHYAMTDLPLRIEYDESQFERE